MIQIVAKGESDWEPSAFLTQLTDDIVEINTEHGIAQMTIGQFKMIVSSWLSLTMQRADNDG